MPSDELRVSENLLGWHLEEGWFKYFGHAGFKRHCPLISVLDKDTVLVCHVNPSGQFCAWEIKGAEPSKLFEADWFRQVGARIRNWPDLVVKDGQILVIGVAEKSLQKQDYAIIVSALNPVQKRIIPIKEVPLARRPCFPKSSLYWLEGVVPLDPQKESYLIACGFDETYLTKHLIFINTEGGVYKNCTMWLTDDTNSALHRVEMMGRFSALKTDYAVSRDGLVHCAWVRWDGSKQKLCYSKAKEWGSWLKPVILYPQKGYSPFSLEDVSIACFSDQAFVLWMADREGVYFMEVTEGKKREIEKIGEWHEYSGHADLGVALLSGAPSSDVAVDKLGNVFAIWVLNKTQFPEGRHRHRLVIKGRLNGVWQREWIVSDGYGIIRSPSLILDDWGQVHIAYLKQTEGDFFACYYRKLKVRNLEKWWAESGR